MNLVSVYLGGGTPSLFGPKRIEELLSLWNCPGEITLEANPETLTADMIQDYSQAGVNWISLGVQSLDDDLLNQLSRTHSAQQAIEAVHRTANIVPNISIDLMYDIPSQTVEQWDLTLKQAISLPIKHISLYNLTIEPHTVFHKYRHELKKNIPNESESCRMYQIAIDNFSTTGFKTLALASVVLIFSCNIKLVARLRSKAFLGSFFLSKIFTLFRCLIYYKYYFFVLVFLPVAAFFDAFFAVDF